MINNLSLYNSLSDSLSSQSHLTPQTGPKIELLKILRQAGVYLKTAQDLVEKHDQATIERHLDYYQFALKKNIAGGPGYLVLSLNENWGPPLGFISQNPNSEESRRRYASWGSD